VPAEPPPLPDAPPVPAVEPLLPPVVPLVEPPAPPRPPALEPPVAGGSFPEGGALGLHAQASRATRRPDRAIFMCAAPELERPADSIL
jgi:hypothetical protein